MSSHLNPAKIVLLSILLALCPWSHTVDASPDSFLLPEIRANHPALTNADVLIDVGHGGVDPGTSYGSLLEKDINLAIAKKTFECLRKKGYIVLLNRSGDYALSSENGWLRTRSRHMKDLAQRSHLANEIKPKVMISLHVNSARNPDRRGPLVLHQKNVRSKQLATALQSALNPLYGVSETPVLGRTYYLLKHTQVPAVIVELGFITNAADRQMLQKQSIQWTISEKITEGITKYLQL
ncbi:N-acetylmuramoyl-L-alanine amidase [Paenibacillus allorhizosphaerae]|uniref:MurNAc-LAA domain-containing protein n=1 Tax=Paenibacillus allorhizosphaerae TaxID=2849866 RepID=A0ABN7TRJ7_9BACL|nr:N-acetylmuramoyl-L-alanine amidase [Paenibacillus allorhizosphaerae]CAG7647978.1 hypothetical protein PAECIP111802_04112 [Paenibacillus allorhizosphaerae]